MKVSEILLNLKKRLSWNDLSDKPSKFPPETHRHLSTEITEDSNHNFVTETQKTKIDKIFPYDSSICTDANSYKENGFKKTSPNTNNLPSVCSENSDKWGVIQFIRESNDGTTGFQTFYPIDGRFKGKMFTRAFCKNTWSEWKVASDFNGSYNSLNDKPTTFPPTSHNHAATDFTEDTTHKFVTDEEKGQWNNKSNKSVTHKVVLSAASWTGEAAPYNYDIPISDMDDNKNWEVTNSVDPLMTEEELNAFCEARIIAGTQSTGHINLVAYGEKPTIDINILVIVRGD